MQQQALPLGGSNSNKTHVSKLPYAAPAPTSPARIQTTLQLLSTTNSLACDPHTQTTHALSDCATIPVCVFLVAAAYKPAYSHSAAPLTT